MDIRRKTSSLELILNIGIWRLLLVSSLVWLLIGNALSIMLVDLTWSHLIDANCMRIRVRTRVFSLILGMHSYKRVRVMRLIELILVDQMRHDRIIFKVLSKLFVIIHHMSVGLHFVVFLFLLDLGLTKDFLAVRGELLFPKCIHILLHAFLGPIIWGVMIRIGSSFEWVNLFLTLLVTQTFMQNTLVPFAIYNTVTRSTDPVGVHSKPFEIVFIWLAVTLRSADTLINGSKCYMLTIVRWLDLLALVCEIKKSEIWIPV